MKPVYREFYNDEEVVNVVKALKQKNIMEDDIYVITHDDDRTDRVLIMQTLIRLQHPKQVLVHP
ncbi:general stress protein [Bacillus sp. JCM 19047]|nr:general stress protein [Bacillus sp. JCM 19047]